MAANRSSAQQMPSEMSPSNNSPTRAQKLGPTFYNRRFVIVALIIFLIVIGSTYIFFLMPFMAESPAELQPFTSEPVTTEETENNENSTQLLTPENEATLQVYEGNIVRTTPEGKQEVIVPTAEEGLFVTPANIALSFDQEHVCFSATSGGPDSQIYVYELESQTLTPVGNGHNCFWSPDSTKIAFNDPVTDISLVHIWVYDVASQSLTNLTENLYDSSEIRTYRIIEWSTDSTQINAEYTVTLGENEGTTATEILQVN